MIELRTLAYFVTTCRAGSFTQAANEFGISVSTLSTTLKALGQDLDLTLFRRSNKSLYPTSVARALMRAAEPLLMAETFARHHLATSDARLKHLIVSIDLSFTVGGISKALRIAVDRMAREHSDVFIEPQWKDDRDAPPHIDLLSSEWRDLPRNQIRVGLVEPGQRRSRSDKLVLSDPWAFAFRMPADTQRPPRAPGLVAGRIVVPLLAPPLIEQADRYFSQHKITGVRFLNEHPGDLPRVLDEYPDAALFVPRSLIAAQLGLSNVAIVEPEHPLKMDVIARASETSPVTNAFIKHLTWALSGNRPLRAERPAISLRQVRYFNLINRVRRISAAARGANISQPALSEQLQKLETSLGTALFDRKEDGVVPTAKGERFARFAMLLESGFRRLTAGESGTALLQNRRVAVGIMPSVNQYGFLVNRVIDAVVEVQARYPALKLAFQEAPNGTLQDWTIRGLVSLAIVETTLPHMPRLPLGSSENLAAITDPAQKLLPPGPVRLSDVLQLKLVLPTMRFGLRQLLDQAATERDLRIQPFMEVDALPMAVSMLSQLAVATVLPPSAVAREIASGALMAHPIIEPTISRRLYVIYSGERSLSAPERALVNALRKKLSENRGDGER